MPALPLPQYGVDKLYLFPYYQTRDAYQSATGHEPPAWNPLRAPKYWEDASAKAATRRNVTYDRAIVYDEKGLPAIGSDGKPVLDSLILPKDEAASVNIPPNGANVEGADVAMVPPPLRALEPNEELFFPFGGVVAVKNLDVYGQIENGFTVQDRALLKLIAKKLGVPLG